MKPFTLEDREKLLKELFPILKALLIDKGKEYSSGYEDTLNNFRDRAKWLNIAPEALLFMDMSKHLDAMKNWAVHGNKLTIEQFDARAIDSMVYLILLIGLYRSEKQKGGR